MRDEIADTVESSQNYLTLKCFVLESDISLLYTDTLSFFCSVVYVLDITLLSSE